MWSFLFGMVVLCLLLVVYCVPSIVARKKKYYQGILLLNMFFGWTIVGWVGALIWAVSSPDKV